MYCVLCSPRRIWLKYFKNSTRIPGVRLRKSKTIVFKNPGDNKSTHAEIVLVPFCYLSKRKRNNQLEKIYWTCVLYLLFRVLYKLYKIVINIYISELSAGIICFLWHLKHFYICSSSYGTCNDMRALRCVLKGLKAIY